MKIIPLELETPFSEGMVNAFLAIGETITLIDTGNTGMKYFQQLKAQLKKHGLHSKNIEQIILTHIHADHSGGVAHLQEEADIPVYVHEKAFSFVYGGIEEFAREEVFFADFFKKCGAESILKDLKRTYQAVNWRDVHFLKDGDTLPIGGDLFEVVYVPGHSQTDIVLWNSETGEAFIGDHLLKLFSVNAFIEPPSHREMPRPKPLLQYRNSLERLKKLPLKTLYPGHGEAYSSHELLIDKRLAAQEKRCSQIRNIIWNEEKTVFEISREMYPRLTGSAIFLGLSQIQGHLDLLESRNQVCFESIGGVLKYQALCGKMEECR